MIDLFGLIKDTGAYRTIKGDKDSNRLSHAYLILSADGDNLLEYLKIFASLMACKESEPCGYCRACSLIDANSYPDVMVFPKKEGAVLAEDVNQLIEESYLKPIEGDKKIFIINHSESMNAAAQNKLLKTLEEPPRNVHIILGATGEYSLLPTVKSRVKKLEIPAFTAEKLYNALKEDCVDRDKLRAAIACGDGTVGKAKSLYGDESLKDVTALALEVLTDMTSSKDVLKYSTKISKVDFSEFLSVIELLLRDILVILQGKEELVSNKAHLTALKNAPKFNTGSVLHALESVTETLKRKKFNVNATMLTEWLLFQILEGKYRWQKL